MKEIKKFILQYSSLLIVLALGLAGIVFFTSNRVLQTGILIAVAVSYVVWGVTHHHMHKDLYASVLLEYILIAIVGVIIILSLILRS